MDEYLVLVYTENSGGYYQYSVKTMEKAIHHGMKILSDGVYRRLDECGNLELLPVYKVKISGPDLNSEYEDEFFRT